MLCWYQRNRIISRILSSEHNKFVRTFTGFYRDNIVRCEGREFSINLKFFPNTSLSKVALLAGEEISAPLLMSVGIDDYLCSLDLS